MSVVVFIDALDEYEGNLQDILDLLLRLRGVPDANNYHTSNTLKFCVSGRPLQEFFDHFNDKPHLLMHDLTAADIKTYVENMIGNLPARPGRLAVSSLIEEIIFKSEGVFLWAYIVVRWVRAASGLSNGDTLRDISDHIDLLPKDLDTLFRIILAQSRRAGALFICMVATNNHHPTAVELHFAAREDMYPEETFYKQPIAELERRSRNKIIFQAKQTINDTSGIMTLLETVGSNGSAYQGLDEVTRVRFIHDTVADFGLFYLDHGMLAASINQRKFDPLNRLALAQLLRLKMCSLPSCGRGWVVGSKHERRDHLVFLGDILKASPKDQEIKTRDRLLQELPSAAVQVLERFFDSEHKDSSRLQSLAESWGADTFRKLGRGLCDVFDMGWNRYFIKPCGHRNRWGKALTLEFAVRFGLSDYLLKNLSILPSECRESWGTFLFALENARRRIIPQDDVVAFLDQADFDLAGEEFQNEDTRIWQKRI
ncbi:hypothetical protein QBC38DRAFT_516509 [Podospora fimiseda]|uniref:Uncharacterized protein n=1 Tax=Podospora fimiseda TaxID=252190 RepID=A0AAN7BI22_9PEZI|nr:hypothetical protein QBC38DRAFT_516509 [Podospora fimiseda]